MFGWIGSITGIIGALLVAFNFEFSKFGYIFFLVSSVTWGIQAAKNGDKALLLLNIFFTMINITGIYRWFGFDIF